MKELKDKCLIIKRCGHYYAKAYILYFWHAMQQYPW